MPWGHLGYWSTVSFHNVKELLWAVEEAVYRILEQTKYKSGTAVAFLLELLNERDQSRMHTCWKTVTRRP